MTLSKPEPVPSDQVSGLFAPTEPVDIRQPLAEVLSVAAQLAREGDDKDKVRARRLKDAYDTIRQAVCPHDRGTHEALYMSGRVTKCRGCGKVLG